MNQIEYLSTDVWYNMVPSKGLLKKLTDQKTNRLTDILTFYEPFLLLCAFYEGPSLYLFHRPSGIAGGKFSLWAKATGRGGANTGNIWELVCLLMRKWHSSPTSFRFQFKLQLRKKKWQALVQKGTQQRRSTQIFPFFSDSS